MLKIKWAKLEGRLKDERYSIVENFFPKKDAEVLFHKLILNVEAIPALSLSVIFQRQVLNIEELASAIVCVHGSHVLASVSPLRINHDLPVASCIDLQLIRLLCQTGKGLGLFFFDQTLHIL